jgi:hypothetical protein
MLQVNYSRLAVSKSLPLPASTSHEEAPCGSLYPSTADLSGRRITGHYRPATPVFIFERDGKQIGRFKSPRKLARAITGGAIVLIAGDTICVGVVS